MSGISSFVRGHGGIGILDGWAGGGLLLGGLVVEIPGAHRGVNLMVSLLIVKKYENGPGC